MTVAHGAWSMPQRPTAASATLRFSTDAVHNTARRYKTKNHIRRAMVGQRSDGDVPARQVQPKLPSPPDLCGKQAEKSWNPSSLAFLGDSVWELYARSFFFHPPSHASKYREAVVKQVRAEAQSKAFTKLVEGGILTDKEAEILRWGKNASGTLPKRLSADKLKRSVYREATAIECLVGYLYVSGNAERLDIIMKYLGFTCTQQL